MIKLVPFGPLGHGSLIHWGGIGPVYPPADDGYSLLESILTPFFPGPFFHRFLGWLFGSTFGNFGPKVTPQGTKSRRFGSQNHPKIDPGTKKSILRDFVKILLFLRRQHDSQGPALPEIEKSRPRTPSGGG